MNPQSPREELEIRITAMLMGELSPEEAAALETQIAGDPELTMLHARLRRAIGLLREVSAIPEQPAPEPARLSDERRARLFAHFKNPAFTLPRAVVVKPKRDWKWAVPLGLAASLIVLLGGAVFVNGFALRRQTSSLGTDLSELRKESEKSHRRNFRVFDPSAARTAAASGGRTSWVEGVEVQPDSTARDDRPNGARWASQPGMIRVTGKNAKDGAGTILAAQSPESKSAQQSQPTAEPAANAGTAANAPGFVAGAMWDTPRVTTAAASPSPQVASAAVAAGSLPSDADNDRFALAERTRSPELNLFGRAHMAAGGPVGTGNVYLPKTADADLKLSSAIQDSSGAIGATLPKPDGTGNASTSFAGVISKSEAPPAIPAAATPAAGGAVTAPALDAVTRGSTLDLAGTSMGDNALPRPSSDTGTLVLNGSSQTVGALAKSGNGTLSFSGANTFTGGTTINGGTLQITNGAALDTGAVKAAPAPSKASGNRENSDRITLIGGTKFTAPLTRNAGAAVTFGESNAYAGYTTTSGGTLQIEKGKPAMPGAVLGAATSALDPWGKPTSSESFVLGSGAGSAAESLGGKEQPWPVRIDYGTPVPDAGAARPADGKFQFNEGYKFGGATSDEQRKGEPNPIGGMIAFWSDDDTAKVNINTAGGDVSSARAAQTPKPALPWAGVEFGTISGTIAGAGKLAVSKTGNTEENAPAQKPAINSPTPALPALRDAGEKTVATAKDSSSFDTGIGNFPGAPGLTVTKSGGGTWQLEGANTYSGSGTTGNRNNVTMNGGASLTLTGGVTSLNGLTVGDAVSGSTIAKGEQRARSEVTRRFTDAADINASETPKALAALPAGAAGKAGDGTLELGGKVAASGGVNGTTASAAPFPDGAFAGVDDIGRSSKKQVAPERGDKTDPVNPTWIAAAGHTQLGRDNLARRESDAVMTGDIGSDVVSNYITKGVEVRNARSNTVGADAARAKALGEVDKEWARPYRRFDRNPTDGNDEAKKNEPARSEKPTAVVRADGLSATLGDVQLKHGFVSEIAPDASAKTASGKAGGAAAQQQFVDVFLGVRKGEDQERAGDLKTAQATYRDATAKLEKLRKESPGWQQDLVDFRLKRTTEALQRIEQQLAAAGAEEARKTEAAKKAAEKDAAEKAAKENEVEKLREQERAAAKPVPNPLVPQPEIATSANAFSTFSLNVSDVAFKLAAASLERGAMPDVSTLRTEEFINAFDYRDPEPAPGAPLAFASERARYPFAQNRDVIRFSVKTAAVGRQQGKPLNVVLLLDNSGSMERADRVRILREGLRTLATQLQPQDKLSIVTFARTPTLRADGVAGDKAAEATARVAEITPEGGTNLAAALDLGYAIALKHYQPGSINHVVLLTDGAANLGDVDPAALKQKVEAHRKQGIALDCFGVGWEGLNDDMLEQLSRNGDGRYGFINTPEEAATNFAGQLAGALHVAASDVKVQVEWNPKRVTSYRQVGYAKHQLTKEQFRDNTVDAAELAAAESGNALYVVEVNTRGEGDLGTVRVRFTVPGTSDYREHEWAVPFIRAAAPLEESSSSLRLAASAAAFSEMLAGSPFATEVTSDRLLGLLNGVRAIYGKDPRPEKLEWMIRQAKSISGR